MHESDDAIQLLIPVSEGQSDYRKLAQWYLALAYLQGGNSEQAKNTLGLLVADGAYKEGEARELIRELDHLKK
jgi:hypothetical protein